MRKSRNTREHNRRTVKKAQEMVDIKLNKLMPPRHRFTFFRVGEDVCAKCGKPRKDHG